MILTGLSLYLLGIVLAGGPRRAVLNWLGTILSVLGIVMIGVELYGKAS